MKNQPTKSSSIVWFFFLLETDRFSTGFLFLSVSVRVGDRFLSSDERDEVPVFVVDIGVEDVPSTAHDDGDEIGDVIIRWP